MTLENNAEENNTGREVFAEFTGCNTEETGEGYSRCSLELEPMHMNARGVPMGGVIFTLADYAYAVAANKDLTAEDVYVSLSSEIHFLGVAKGKKLIAEAREIRKGSRTCLYGVSINDELGTQVAYATVSGMRIS